MTSPDHLVPVDAQPVIDYLAQKTKDLTVENAHLYGAVQALSQRIKTLEEQAEQATADGGRA